MTIHSQTTIQELLDLGLLSEAQFNKLSARSERLAKKAEVQQLVQGTADAIIELLASDDQSENKYFSVKKTSNSIGFMDFVETDRGTVLKAVSLLVSQDKLRKIGLVGGEEKPASEVNAFQIRYARA